MSFKRMVDPTKFFGSSMKDALTPDNLVLWGETLLISRDAADGWQPLGDPRGNLRLVNIPRLGWDRPVLFTLDLLIIDTATGLPPDPALLPTPPYQNAGFRVLWGAGNDSREFLLEPGIHSLLGETLRVNASPQDPTGWPITWQFRAHCTVQEGVSPSYVIAGP